jgi:hypothetical protein
MRFCISDSDIYRTDREDRNEGGTAVAGIPYTCAVKVEIGHTDMLLASVYKSPERLWSDRHHRAIRF